ncbi:hypothetical protein V6N12_034107 [Hibiscus sabdariffa]|uniref:Retrotransposon gag domain-containing protein n=1 Tax=Hibiscus sabdariffa TaxID=183260 RepID=A0ABR2BGS9_9ROSI
MNGDPTVGPLGEDNGKFVFLVDYGPKGKEESPDLYNKDFPPLKEFTEKEFRHIPKIPTQLHGEKVSAAEANLNWQTENALAQNATLQRIDTRVTQMDTKITMVETKVDSKTKIANELIVALHRMLREVEKRSAEPGQDLLYHIEQKTQEIQRLKDHIKRDPPPSPKVFNYHTVEPRRLTPYELREHIRKQEAEQKRERDRRENSPEEDGPTPKADNHVQSSSESKSSEDSQSSSEQTLSGDDLLMAIPEVKTEGFDPMDTDASPSTSTPPLFQINTGKHIFTLDDIPSTRWPQRFQEFHAWMDTQKLTRESNYEILTEFVSRFTGTLRDWWNSLSQPDQVAFLTRQNFSEIMQVLHTFFLGN